MANIEGFDANTVEPQAAFDAIEPGDYNAVITESELKPTKAGNGQYLMFKFEIIDGKRKGRTLFANLNLDNPNTTTVGIARAQLSAICRAVGIMQPKDTVELHNLPLVIQVKCKKSDAGEITNDIKGFKAKGSATPVASSAPSKPVWQR